MGIQERKERARLELREHILTVAERLFVENGYENVSMRKIADEIEYSPTTIYRVFRNKADIVEQLIDAGYRGVYARYKEILSREYDSPLETLRAIIGEYAGFALDHPNHYQLWFATGRLTLIDGQLRMHHGDASYRVYHVWLDRIDECKAAGLLAERDTLALFQLIWGAVHGMISLRIHHPDFPWMALERHLNELFAMIENGLQ